MTHTPRTKPPHTPTPRPPTLSDSTTLELSTYRDQLYAHVTAIKTELTQLEQRIEAIDAMLAPHTHTRVTVFKPKHIIPHRASKAEASKPDHIPKSLRSTLTVVQQLGDRGVTSKALAQLLNVPMGTAGSRLSILKQRGLVRHNTDTGTYHFIVSPTPSVNVSASVSKDITKTMVVHSKQEDNNTANLSQAGGHM